MYTKENVDKILSKRLPAMYQNCKVNNLKGIGSIIFINIKVDKIGTIELALVQRNGSHAFITDGGFFVHHILKYGDTGLDAAKALNTYYDLNFTSSLDSLHYNVDHDLAKGISQFYIALESVVKVDQK